MHKDRHWSTSEFNKYVIFPFAVVCLASWFCTKEIWFLLCFVVYIFIVLCFLTPRLFVFGHSLLGETLPNDIHKSQEQYEYERDWTPKKNDIICLTFPRCGQTLLLHLMNQIRSGGKCTESLQSVVWWPTRAWNYKIDLNANQKYEPRIFKSFNKLSHYSQEFGAKFVTIIRDPAEILLSLHDFSRKMGKTDLNIGQFADEYFFLENENVFQYYVDFWKIHNRPEVLILSLNDVIENRVEIIHLLAKFMNLNTKFDDHTLATIVNKTKKFYMFENQHLFTGIIELELAEKHGRDLDIGTPPPVVTYRNNQHTLDRRTRKKLQIWWTNVVTEQTGFENFEEFESAVTYLRPRVLYDEKTCLLRHNSIIL